MTAAIKDELLGEAAALGFDAVRVTTPDAVKGAGERLAAFLEAGRHGDMEWMATHADRRRSRSGSVPVPPAAPSAKALAVPASANTERISSKSVSATVSFSEI